MLSLSWQSLLGEHVIVQKSTWSSLTCLSLTQVSLHVYVHSMGSGLAFPGCSHLTSSVWLLLSSHHPEAYSAFDDRAFSLHFNHASPLALRICWRRLNVRTGTSCW